MNRDKIIEILKECEISPGYLHAERYEIVADRLEQQPAKEYPFKCNKCGFEFTSDDLGHTYLTCTQPFPQRTSGICGGAIELNYLEQQPEVSDIEKLFPTDDDIEQNGKDGGLKGNELQMYWEGGVWMKRYMIHRLQSHHPKPITDDQITVTANNYAIANWVGNDMAVAATAYKEGMILILTEFNK